jgi:hypothetical protein
MYLLLIATSIYLCPYGIDRLEREYRTTSKIDTKVWVVVQGEGGGVGHAVINLV